MQRSGLMNECRRPALWTTLAVLAGVIQANPTMAQSGGLAVVAPSAAEPAETVVVTAARVGVPRSPLPFTIQVITPQETRVQAQIGGSAVDAVAALVPSFSPTSQKLSRTGAREL